MQAGPSWSQRAAANMICPCRLYGGRNSQKTPRYRVGYPVLRRQESMPRNQFCFSRQETLQAHSTKPGLPAGHFKKHPNMCCGCVVVSRYRVSQDKTCSSTATNAFPAGKIWESAKNTQEQPSITSEIQSSCDLGLLCGVEVQGKCYPVPLDRAQIKKKIRGRVRADFWCTQVCFLVQAGMLRPSWRLCIPFGFPFVWP